MKSSKITSNLKFSDHYKEYLSILLNRYGLDPVEVYNKNKIWVLYDRHKKEMPPQQDGEDDNAYTQRLRQVCC